MGFCWRSQSFIRLVLHLFPRARLRCSRDQITRRIEKSERFIIRIDEGSNSNGNFYSLAQYGRLRFRHSSRDCFGLFLGRQIRLQDPHPGTGIRIAHQFVRSDDHRFAHHFLRIENGQRLHVLRVHSASFVFRMSRRWLHNGDFVQPIRLGLDFLDRFASLDHCAQLDSQVRTVGHYGETVRPSVLQRLPGRPVAGDEQATRRRSRSEDGRTSPDRTPRRGAQRTVRLRQSGEE